MTTLQFTQWLLKSFWLLWAVGLVGCGFIMRDTIKHRKRKVYEVDRI